jgi:hypothetical protein
MAAQNPDTFRGARQITRQQAIAHAKYGSHLGGGECPARTQAAAKLKASSRNGFLSSSITAL